MANRLSRTNLNDYKTLREVVFNTIREAIIMGELKPGERLLEMHLAEKMGVSRTPVREALRRLELENLVKTIPRKGAHVAALSAKDIMDVLEVRTSLDGLATALAAERITDAELKELENIRKQFNAYAEKDNLQGLIKKDVEFHDVIYRASRNQRLIQIINNLREQVHRFRVIYMKDYSSSSDLIKEHADIYNAISQRNADLAVKVAQEHIKNQKAAIIRAIDRNNLK